MRVFILILVLVTLQNIARADISSNMDMANHYSSSSVEFKELKSMSISENTMMNDCINEAMTDETVMEMDHYESTDYCINEVLGDIHN